MLQACLNGGRMRDFHPALPFTASEIARDAALAVAAGARELHIHPRGPDGMETLEPDHIAETLQAVRSAVPGIPVGLSTHWRIPPGGLSRQEPIHRWTTLPDYVSINLIEEDAEDLIAHILGRGIGVEAGLWSVSDAERFVGLKDAAKCLRVLIEINEQDIDEGLRAADGIQAVLRKAGNTLPILMHGDEASVWPIYGEAMAKGFDSRIGLEDGNLLPSGQMAQGNADLIRAALDLMSR
jgi:uncharacterized protein (DUF849 family)